MKTLIGQCHLCRFWCGLERDGQTFLRDGEAVGECRVYAPGVSFFGSWRKWPQTGATDSCGEFQHKAEAAE